MSPKNKVGKKRKLVKGLNPLLEASKSKGGHDADENDDIDFEFDDVIEVQESAIKRAKRIKKAVISKGNNDDDDDSVRLVEKFKKKTDSKDTSMAGTSKDVEKKKKSLKSSIKEAPHVKKQSKGRGHFPSIQHRSRTDHFIDLFDNIKSEEKKDVIKRSGFGSILQLPPIEIPKKLAHWIVSNYDPRRGVLKIEYGEVIDVSEEDVERCLGIPRGVKKVERIVPSENNVLANEWRNHIGKLDDPMSIWPHHICSVMLGTDNIDEFLRDFIILFYSCIVEPPQSGCANQNLIMPLDEMKRLSEYNWCGFVLKCLDDTKVKWESNPSASFTGPITFLLFLYLDRVVNFRQRNVPRNVPFFIGWTPDLVMKRELVEMESGGFRRGRIELMQRVSTKTTKARIGKQKITMEEEDMPTSQVCALLYML